MKKITNLTMNLYILLNSNTVDGFKYPLSKILTLQMDLETHNSETPLRVSESIRSVRI